MPTNLTPEQRRRMHEAARNVHDSMMNLAKIFRVFVHRINSISQYNRKVRRALARGNRIQAGYYHLQHLRRAYKGTK